MKRTLIALTATVVMSLGSVALADETQGPVMLTDAQMDNVVAAGPGDNGKAHGWNALDAGEATASLWSTYGDGVTTPHVVPLKYNARPKGDRSNKGRSATFSDCC